MLDSHTNAQWSIAASEIMTTAVAQRNPHVLMRPVIFPDGNQWCALYGEDLQQGVAGFGDTPAAAAMDFDANWMRQKLTAGVAPCDCARRLAGRVTGDVHLEGCPNFVAPHGVIGTSNDQ